jgi:hypothetical protein
MTPSATTANVATPSFPLNDVDLMLHKAERYFLQKKYKEALFSVNQAFVHLQAAEHSPNNQRCQNGNVIPLSPPLQILGRKYTLSVILINHENRIDELSHTVSQQLAAIGLQSWHELSKTEKAERRRQNSTRQSLLRNTDFYGRHAMKHLEPILNYFSVKEQGFISDSNGKNSFRHGSDMDARRALTLDLFLVWTHFWQSHGCEKEVLTWTVQVLMASCRLRLECQTGKDGETNEAKWQRLWVHCVSHQLPHLNNANNIRQILRAISTIPDSSHEWDGVSLKDACMDMRDDCSSESVDALLDTLQEMQSVRNEDKEQSQLKGVGSASCCLIPPDCITAAKTRLTKLHHGQNQSVVSRLKGSQTDDEMAPCNVMTIKQNGQSQHNVFDGFRNNVQRTSSVPNSVVTEDPSSLYMRLKQTRLLSWISQTFRDFVLQALNKNAQCGSCADEDVSFQWRRRFQQTALALAFLLLSWRQRKLVSRVGKLMAMALLAPVRELVDALNDSDGSNDGEHSRSI